MPFWSAVVHEYSGLGRRSASKQSAVSSRLGSFRTVSLLSTICAISTISETWAFINFSSSVLSAKPNSARRFSFIPTTKLEAPPSERNKEVIWEVLQKQIATRSELQSWRALEVAAGYGVHTEHFNRRWCEQGNFPKCEAWYATDPSSESRASIEAYVGEAVENGYFPADQVKTPCLELTLNENGIAEEGTGKALFGDSADSKVDLIVCINMIHISPWEATVGLMKLAGDRLSAEHGFLYCYGPYKENGTAVESNLKFDVGLKARDPAWGVRDLEEVVATAKTFGLELVERIEMPANNLSLVFSKAK